MSIFVLGGTGTLGLQIVVLGRKKNLDVTCLVRRPSIESDSLTYMGARVFFGDMNDESVLLESLFGCNIIIDAVTGRVQDSFEKVEYDGKLMLLRFAKELEIDRFVFFSLVNAEKFDTIPLIEAKLYLESVIKKSSVPYTIFRLTGFYQGLITEYGNPIIDRTKVYLTDNNMPISYIDCMDVARLVLRSFTSPKFLNETINISGLKAWTPKEVLSVCEKKAGLKARTVYSSIFNILAVRFITSLFESTWYITRKLALIDIIRRNTPDLMVDPQPMFEIFQIKPSELRPFELFVSHYYEQAFEVLFKRYGGSVEDDEKEIDKWRQKGVSVSEVPVSELEKE